MKFDWRIKKLCLEQSVESSSNSMRFTGVSESTVDPKITFERSGATFEGCTCF